MGNRWANLCQVISMMSQKHSIDVCHSHSCLRRYAEEQGEAEILSLPLALQAMCSDAGLQVKGALIQFSQSRCLVAKPYSCKGYVPLKWAHFLNHRHHQGQWKPWSQLMVMTLIPSPPPTQEIANKLGWDFQNQDFWLNSSCFSSPLLLCLCMFSHEGCLENYFVGNKNAT